MIQFFHAPPTDAQLLLRAFIAELKEQGLPQDKINAVLHGVVERMAGKAKTDQSKGAA